MTRKIVFLISAMSEGGAERVAANLVSAWAAQGDEVLLVPTFSGRGSCHYRLAEGVRVVYLADEARVSGKGPVAYARRFHALRRLLRRESPDVVVSFLTNVNVAAILCTIGLHVPVVVSERIFPPAYPVGRTTEVLRRLLYPAASRVVMQTTESMRWLESAIPRARGVLIPNPVAFPVPATKPDVPPESLLAGDRKLLLAAGRLHAQKGFDVLLAAFEFISRRYPDWDLVVLGEGPERGALEAQGGRLGIAGRMFLPGQVGNVRDWYDRADVYVMSSRFEGFPNSLAEAMAHGCAVVSFDCDTGPRDLIRDEQDGLLVRPVGDPVALAMALDRLMSDERFRSGLARAAIIVRDRFSPARVLATWNSLLDDAMASRTPAA